MASEDFRCEENVRTEFLLMRMGCNITYSMQKFKEIDVTSSFTKRKSPDMQKNNQSEKHTAVLICDKTQRMYTGWIRSALSDTEKGHWRLFLLDKHIKRGCYASDSITFATALNYAHISCIYDPQISTSQEVSSLRLTTALKHPP